MSFGHSFKDSILQTSSALVSGERRFQEDQEVRLEDQRGGVSEAWSDTVSDNSSKELNQKVVIPLRIDSGDKRMAAQGTEGSGTGMSDKVKETQKEAKRSEDNFKKHLFRLQCIVSRVATTRLDLVARANRLKEQVHAAEDAGETTELGQDASCRRLSPWSSK